VLQSTQLPPEYTVELVMLQSTYLPPEYIVELVNVESTQLPPEYIVELVTISQCHATGTGNETSCRQQEYINLF
jgi:hypothetical protein